MAGDAMTNTDKGAVVLNARIESVSIGLDRDAFLCGWVRVEKQDGFHQGFGGFVLGGIPGTKAGRHSEQRNLAAEWMVGVMRAADVEKYQDASGKIIRVRMCGDGFHATISAIGHAIKDDRWFCPAEAFKKMGADHD